MKLSPVVELSAFNRIPARIRGPNEQEVKKLKDSMTSVEWKLFLNTDEGKEYMRPTHYTFNRRFSYEIPGRNHQK